MLRNLLVVSTSGIVLFEKSFVKAKQPGQLGGVISAMLEFSQLRTGLPVSYIELSNVGCAISTNSGAKIICALFHDVKDGAEFGRLICGEILSTFIQNYSSKFPLEGKLNIQEQFSDFNSKIAEIIRNSVKPVLDRLRVKRGIVNCLLTSGDSLHYSTDEVDKLGVLANHQALVGYAHEIMAVQSDLPLQITLTSKDTSLVLHRIERASLVVVYHKGVDCRPDIEHTAQLLKKVLVMASNLQLQESAVDIR